MVLDEGTGTAHAEPVPSYYKRFFSSSCGTTLPSSAALIPFTIFLWTYYSEHIIGDTLFD